MNEVLSQLHARKSVRAFLDRPISPEARRAILEAACAAPTAGNQQLYTILDITDQAVKDTLADTCDHQPFIARAPLVLIFCADCQKWYDAFAAGGCSPRRPGPGDLWLALSDANIAAQNAVTAAWSRPSWRLCWPTTPEPGPTVRGWTPSASASTTPISPARCPAPWPSTSSPFCRKNARSRFWLETGGGIAFSSLLR